MMHGEPWRNRMITWGLLAAVFVALGLPIARFLAEALR